MGRYVFVVLLALFLGATSASAMSASPACTIQGTPGDDSLVGTHGDDVICGFGGEDTLHGSSGNDRLFGRKDHDRIYGGRDIDRLEGGQGNDDLFGGERPDIVDGGDGSDQMTGGPGNGGDILLGRDGNDCLDVGNGSPNDTALGDAGRDVAPSDDDDYVRAEFKGPKVTCPSMTSLGHTIRLFHGRTNDHFWNLDASHRGRTWQMELTSSTGKVLFRGGKRTLGARSPAVYGYHIWLDPEGPASIVFGLGRVPHANALRVLTTDPAQRRAVLTEEIHPTRLPSTLAFFLQDFSGKIKAIEPERRR